MEFTLTRKPNTRPNFLTSSAAYRCESRNRQFSATLHVTLFVSTELRYHCNSAVAVSTSFAIGFSARTCFPASKAFLIYDGWLVIGNLRTATSRSVHQHFRVFAPANLEVKGIYIRNNNSLDVCVFQHVLKAPSLVFSVIAV